MLNAQLRDELEPYIDESVSLIHFRQMSLSEENCFLESMLAWERAPALPISCWSLPELVLPRPSTLDDDMLSEILDDAIQRFVDLGYTGSPVGLYHRSSSSYPYNHPDFLGRVGTIDFGNRYDTWHPSPMMPTFPPYAPRTDVTDLGLGATTEIPLRAIRIKIRYYDETSRQMRDLTFTFTLNRDNSAK